MFDEAVERGERRSGKLPKKNKLNVRLLQDYIDFRSFPGHEVVCQNCDNLVSQANFCEMCGAVLIHGG